MCTFVYVYPCMYVVCICTNRVMCEIYVYVHTCIPQSCDGENCVIVITGATRLRTLSVVMQNEAMTGQLTQNPAFSRITLAALEDSG